MKKFYFIFMFIFISIFLISCDKPEEEQIDPSEVVFTATVESIDIDEEFTLKAKVNPEGASQRITWTSSDSSIIEVTPAGVIKGKSEGIAIIKAASSTKPSVFKEIAIEVIDSFVFLDPTSVEFTTTRNQVTINSYIQLGVIVLPEGASQEVVYESSDPNIISVDNNGRATGKVIGNATITVRVVADLSIFATFELEVIEAQTGGENEPMEIVITGEKEVEVGNTIILTANVLPQGVSQSVIWESSDPNLATINAAGKVSALGEGKVYITAISVEKPQVEGMIQLTIKPEVFLSEPENLQGYEITLMHSPNMGFEHNPRHEDYIPADKQARQRAWDEVEELFNTKIVFAEFPTTAAWGTARVQWINENAALNNSQADIMEVTTEWLSSLVAGNSIVDVSEFYETYGKNQMSASLKQSSTMNGAMYALNRRSPGSLHIDQGLYYNYGLVKSLGIDSPAKIFNDGDWTYSNFIEYVRNANALLEDGQTVLSGQPSLYWFGMTNAGGVKLLDTITLEVNFSNIYSIQALNTLKAAYDIGGWGDIAYDSDVLSFNTGNSIFQSGEIWFIREIARWSPTMWGEGTTEFGYVPYPRPDRISKNETRITAGVGQAYMLIHGVDRPSYVTNEAVYRVWNETVLRTIRYMESDPEYNEDILMSATAEFIFDDPESQVAATFVKEDKLIFDPIVYGVVNYAVISSDIAAVVTTGKDMFQVFTQYQSTYQTALINLFG